MALKLASGLGAHVTLLTRSPGKEQDARRLGADRIVLSTDEAQMAAVNGQFDLIIDTVPYVHDINPYLPTLAKLLPGDPRDYPSRRHASLLLEVIPG